MDSNKSVKIFLSVFIGISLLGFAILDISMYYFDAEVTLNDIFNLIANASLIIILLIVRFSIWIVEEIKKGKEITNEEKS